MPEPTTPRALPRRGFLQLIATAVAAVPAAALAQTTTPPATPVLPEHSGNEARLVTEVLRARYPDRFSETQWTSIVGDVDGDLAGGKRLRSVKLANADEPDITFRP